MAKKKPALELPNLAAGTDRFENGDENRTFAGYDIEEVEGYIQRRPAFTIVGSGAVSEWPKGQCFFADSSFTKNYRRIPVLSTGSNTFYICNQYEPFSAIRWQRVTATPSSPTAHAYISSLEYWNGSSFTAITNWIDTTVSVISNGGNFWAQSLTKDGIIAWHPVSNTGGTNSSLGTAYVLKVTITVSGGSITVSPPGISTCRVDPITTGISVRYKDGINGILLCGGRDDATVSVQSAATAPSDHWAEYGAYVGFQRSRFDPPEPLAVVKPEGRGSGYLGSYDWDTNGNVVFADLPDSTASGAAARSWPSGSGWTTSAASGTVSGSAVNTLSKNDRSFKWTGNLFRGGDVISTLVCSSVSHSTGHSATISKNTVWTVSSPSLTAHSLVGCRLYCYNAGGGTITVGDYGEIIANSSSSITTYGYFSGTVDANTRFRVERPASKMNYFGSTLQEGYSTIGDSSDHTITLAYTPAIGSPPVYYDEPNQWSNAPVIFEIKQQLRHQLPPGDFWTHCYDPITQRVILSNGISGLLVFNGQSLEPLNTLFDPENARVQLWVAGLPDTDIHALNTKTIAGAQLRRSPPIGQFITDYQGRIVVADKHSVWWSAPGLDNDIWPYLYETQIRDSENNEITGMTTLDNVLVVWTATSVFGSPGPDDTGLMAFTPLAQGLGFSSSRAVCKIVRKGASYLLGPNHDGVYMYKNGEPISVMSDWRRLLPSGVNVRRMHKAVGAVNRSNNRYYLAVPSANSQANDIVLVYDWIDDNWWVWRAPFGGVSCIFTDRDDFGFELVYFCFEDGSICTLQQKDTDDGTTITGWARSAPIQPVGGMTLAPTHMMVTAKETGSNTLSVRAYLNKRVGNSDNPGGTAVSDEFAAGFDEGSDVYGSDVYGTGIWGGEGWSTEKLNLGSGTRCEVFQFEVRGTGRWAFKSAELISAVKGQRSRR